MKESADALMTILNDILDFSKIEAGKLELVAAEFSLRDCIEDCLRLLAVRAHQKGLELSLDLAAGVPDTLVGDSGRLRQILVNLVGNAVKFTESGGVLVRVFIEHSGAESHRLHCSVADSGIGVPAGAREKIFERFEQSDCSTVRRYGGTGLGLAITAKLVRLMGGRIWVTSPWTDAARFAGGPGSVFHFTSGFAVTLPHLPAEAPERNALQGAPVPVVDTAESPSLPYTLPWPLRTADVAVRRLRVLAAEDNAVNQKLIARLLERRGHEVAIAADGRQALEAA